MSQREVNTLIQILCSSFYISRYVDQELPIKELAIDLYKLIGTYGKEAEETLQEFDGYTFEDVEAAIFKSRRNKLKKKLDSLVEKLEFESPEPIRSQNGSGKNSSIYKKADRLNADTHRIIQKWYSEFKALGGSTCYKFEQEEFDEIKKKLKHIARYQIKLKAMDQVAEEASLEGKYKFYKEFESVPDACSYYEKKLGDKVSRDLLKAQIKDKARIIEDGQEVSWKKINGRINSWVDYENDKPNKKKVIPTD